MLWQHFGVGSATTIDSIIVTFTTSTVKVLTNVAVNQFLRVTDLDCLVGITSNETPVKYELEQNYPKPFNPITRIKFLLMKASNVKLSVFDVTGRFIRYIVNENQSAGAHQYDFDGSNLASGIYIYKIETDEFTDTKKMVLIK